MVHQTLVLQNSSEDPGLHLSLDQGKMGLCCSTSHNLGEREGPGDVSVVLGFSPPPIWGDQDPNFNRKPKKSEMY